MEDLSLSFQIMMISVGISLITIISLFIFFARFNSLKNLIERQTDLHRQYWVEKRMGNKDKAYEILKHIYVGYLYEDYQNSKREIEKAKKVDEGYLATLRKECESLGKPMIEFTE